MRQVSTNMRAALKRVAREGQCHGRAYQANFTDQTMKALEARGLIEQASDQSIARYPDILWVATELGETMVGPRGSVMLDKITTPTSGEVARLSLETRLLNFGAEDCSHDHIKR